MISDFFGNMFDSVGDFFGNITDWMNDNLTDGPWPALIAVVLCTVIGIATL
jgi:hypothetical protein